MLNSKVSMKSRYANSIALAFLLTVSSSANAWFFFFIPGSVTSAIGDALTGAEGSHCVPESARVGDKFRLADGGFGTVKSLSGKSSRCSNPNAPVRALIEPDNNSGNIQQWAGASADTENHSTSNQNAEGSQIDLPQQIVPGVEKITFDLPPGFELEAVSTRERTAQLFFATNKEANIRVLVSAVNRPSDITTYIKATQTSLMRGLTDVKLTEISNLQINGYKAYAYTAQGTFPTSNKASYTYLVTVIEGADQLVSINVWTDTPRYLQNKSLMERVAERVGGIPKALSENIPVLTPTKTTIEPALPRSEASVESSPRQLTTAQRLRELNALFSERLISEKDFETKKKEILDGL